MQLLTLTHALHFVSGLAADDGAVHSEGSSAPHTWTAILKSDATNHRRGCARAFMYDALSETLAENLRMFVESLVNDARKTENHRYWETRPCSCSS